MNWARRIVFAISFILFLQITAGTTVYAADGKLYIMLSDSSVSVGDTIKVTLCAIGSNEENASADMVFTYDTEVFSFVNCDTENYSGGPGGSVSVRGSSVVVTLKSIGSGSAYMKVTGSNGTVRGSGESLDSMVAAGATVEVSASQSQGQTTDSENQTISEKSDDNSLSELRLSVGELSPEFQYSVTNYTATVPENVSSVEVTAVPSNEKAEVESISGNSDLQMGENTISITVKAENGDVSTYTIVATKTEDASVSQEDGVSDENQENLPNPQENQGDVGVQNETLQDVPLTNQQIEEYESRISLLSREYTKLEEKYNKEKASYMKIFAVLIFVIVLLLIACVNLLIFRNRRAEEFDYDEIDFYEEDTKKKRKGKKDSSIQEADWLDEGLEDEWARQEYERLSEEEDDKRHMDFIDFEDL